MYIALRPLGPEDWSDILSTSPVIGWGLPWQGLEGDWITTPLPWREGGREGGTEGGREREREREGWEEGREEGREERGKERQTDWISQRV